jgi:hypothetical protein
LKIEPRNTAVFEWFVTNLLLNKYNLLIKSIEKIYFPILIIYILIKQKEPTQINE